jgi:hypothetical protein
MLLIDHKFEAYLHFHFVVTMLAQEEAPLNMQCKDQFVFQTIYVRPGATTKDISPKMVTKNSKLFLSIEIMNHNIECVK